MTMKMAPKQTAWQARAKNVLRWVEGAVLVFSGLALALWEAFHNHNHAGHQIMAGVLIGIGAWRWWEDKFLRALETVADIAYTLLPWGSKGKGD